MHVPGTNTRVTVGNMKRSDRLHAIHIASCPTCHLLSNHQLGWPDPISQSVMPPIPERCSLQSIMGLFGTRYVLLVPTESEYMGIDESSNQPIRFLNDDPVLLVLSPEVRHRSSITQLQGVISLEIQMSPTTRVHKKILLGLHHALIDMRHFFGLRPNRLIHGR